MQNVRKSFDEKQAQFNEMQRAMSEATNRNINNQLKLTKMEVSNEYVSEKIENPTLSSGISLINWTEYLFW